MTAMLRLAYIAALVVLSSLVTRADAQHADPADSVCARSVVGAAVSNPPELRSHNGVLEATLTFRSAVDSKGWTRYCYVSDSGLEAPTLRVNPGDLLVIHFRNAIKPAPVAPNRPASHTHAAGIDTVSGRVISDSSSTNLHFHGMHIPPTFHQDEVIRTDIPTGGVFDYRVRIPKDHPPGLYWYHPHLHGASQQQLQGGASGALIVEGAQAVNPELAGLPERVLVVRDQPLPVARNQRQSTAPSWDISVNHAPVTYPDYEPATILVKPDERQFWRVVNAAANTILDLQLIVNGAVQSMQVFSIDGVPISGGPQIQNDILLGPGARAEFIVTTPKTDEAAQLITRRWDTGPTGDNDPQRPLANIVPETDVQESRLPTMPKRAFSARDLAKIKPTVERNLYFAESATEQEGEAPGAGSDDDANTRFYLFVGGQGATLFDMNAAPNLVVHQGTVEDWTITNTTSEDHVFHIHQLHFQVLEIDGQPVHDPALKDTFIVPHMRRNGPLPSVKLRMDFRGANLEGIFVFQCHIIAHEEGGMMGTIRVLPPGLATSVELFTSVATAELRQPITVTAKVRSTANTGVPASGTVQFAIDGNIDGPPIPLSGEKADRVFSFYRSDVHTISAIYSGDFKYDASQARPVTITSTGN